MGCLLCSVRLYISAAPMWRALLFFFFNDTATTEIYTLSLHDALPISYWKSALTVNCPRRLQDCAEEALPGDRKSTRLNSSHSQISYAVFCLKKKKCYATPSTAVLTQHPSGHGRGLHTRPRAGVHSTSQ